MKKNISAIAIYIITTIELLINNKLDLIFKGSYELKYVFLKFILFILFSISVGFLSGIISGEKAKSRKEKISNFIIIVIPSIIMMLSKFIIASGSIANLVPEFIKADKGILILVGGFVFGSILFSTLKKKQDN